MLKSSNEELRKESISEIMHADNHLDKRSVRGNKEIDDDFTVDFNSLYLKVK